MAQNTIYTSINCSKLCSSFYQSQHYVQWLQHSLIHTILTHTTLNHRYSIYHFTQPDNNNNIGLHIYSMSCCTQELTSCTVLVGLPVCACPNENCWEQHIYAGTPPEQRYIYLYTVLWGCYYTNVIYNLDNI